MKLTHDQNDTLPTTKIEQIMKQQKKNGDAHTTDSTKEYKYTFSNFNYTRIIY